MHRCVTFCLLVACFASLAGCPVAVPPDDSGNANGGTANTNSNGPGGDNANLNSNGAEQPLDDGLTATEARQIAEDVALAAVYGDASAGTLRVTEDIRLGDQGDVNMQFEDVIIETGVTLTVQSGTVIRCRGTFENRGSIVVQTGAEGGGRAGVDASTQVVSENPPQPGISTLAAAGGEAGDSTAERSGGAEGTGLSEFESRANLSVGVLAGGGGGAGAALGGDGGGGFTVVAAGAIRSQGEVMALGDDGANGSGGGGGGVVIFASRTSITNT
ncbi:MAG: hypothetical protein D6744_18300, partial [Planctomycetota bacterium]